MDYFARMAEAKQAAMAGGACPRASVACALYSASGSLLAIASNARLDGPCNCNTDTTDTVVAAGTSCLALHSEVAALIRAAKNATWPLIRFAVVTRAPCRNCLAALLASPCGLLAVSQDWPDRDGVKPMWEAQGRKWLWID